MIRVSNGPIRLSKYETDRWGQPVVYWSVNWWGYIDIDRFAQLTWFEQPVDFSVVDRLRGQIEVISDKLKFSHGTTVYQFNAMRKPTEYVRLCAVMNNPDPVDRITHIPWFDAHVKYHVYSALCRVLNFFTSRHAVK